MRRLKKLCALALCLALAVALAGCGAKEEAVEQTESLDIYASFYPVYAVAALIADGVPDLALHLLAQPQDGCLRGYSLSDWDAALLASADGILLCGGGLESFADSVSARAGDRLAVVRLSGGAERMEVEALNADPDRESHWQGENPHVYLSTDGAIELCVAAAQSMAVLDPRYEDVYLENLANARERLERLREEIAAEAANLAGVRAAVLNEALVYAAREYGLDAVYWERESGAGMGESELAALLDALNERGVCLVLIERQAPRSLLDALEGAGFSVAAMDVLSTHRADEGDQAYFDALLGNAAAVRAAYERIAREEE